MTHLHRTCVLLVTVAICGCAGGEAPAATPGLTWDTLPSGAMHAVYASLPAAPPLAMGLEARIGGIGAVGPAALADVRGIDIDPGGAIVVLDYQASEVRVFDPQGSYLGTVARRGEGPAEIVRANGIRFDSTGALWINDHGRRQVTRLGQDRAFATHPMPASGFGYVWEGGITRDGRIWDFQRSSADPEAELRTATTSGPQEVEARVFLMSVDPATGARDSVALGNVVNRFLRFTRTSGSRLVGAVNVVVPFTPAPLAAFDPTGAVWTAASSGEYRLVKQSLTGDTLLVVEIPGEGPAVADEERSAEIAKVEEFLANARQRGGAEGSDRVDWDALVPHRKPILIALSVDDRGRLWAQRRTDAGPVFDVLAPTGELLGTVDPAFEPWPFFPPVVRGTQMYALVTDSLDVPSVVRAPVPLR